MDTADHAPEPGRPINRTSAVACPRCGSPMETGRAYVAGSFLGFLAVGLSWQHLWFETAHGARKVVKSSTLSSNIVPARSCPACGVVVLEPPPARPA